jgi:hypothetical protein
MLLFLCYRGLHRLGGPTSIAGSTVYGKLGLPIKKDSKVDNVVTETDHEKGLTDRELKKECFLYAREKFQGRLFKNTKGNM